MLPELTGRSCQKDLICRALLQKRPTNLKNLRIVHNRATKHVMSDVAEMQGFVVTGKKCGNKELFCDIQGSFVFPVRCNDKHRSCV